MADEQVPRALRRQALEINGRELLSLAPLAVLVLTLGFWPRPLLNIIDKGSLDMHRLVDRPGPTQVASAHDGADTVSATASR